MSKKTIFQIVVTFNIIIIYLLYFNNNQFLNIIDSKIRDTFFLIRGKIKPTNEVTIVDIDEKSLKVLGQWPWNRKILSRIITNLTNSGAGIIGLDIFFSEKDKKSPSYLSKKLNLNIKNPIDYDKIFAQTIQNSPTILGFMLNFENNTTKNPLPSIPGIIIEKNLKTDFLIKATGYISNIPIIQKSAYSSGFLNIIPDNDGVIRSLPLLAKYKEIIFPSLTFEMYRIALNSNLVTINYSQSGINNIKLNSQTINTDRFGRIYINYRGPNKTFNYISAVDVYNNNFDKNLVFNKFILLGTSAFGLYDLRVTPYSTNFPGIEVHANALDNLIKNDYLYKPDYIESIEILLILALNIIVGYILYKVKPLKSFIISISTIVLIVIINYYLFVNLKIIMNISYLLFSLITLLLILIFINFYYEYQHSQKIKSLFSKKVSPQIVNLLLDQDENEIFTPKESEATIFFSDIRSFTSISEKLNDPKKVIEMLNTYFNPVSEIIISNNGTIDKFIGDAIMAYWNIPLKIENHADKCIISALTQINKLKEINKIIKKNYNIEINIGIGINTGIVTYGEIGAKGRADFSIIGDSVNLASRLEGLNKYYGTTILISEYTKEKLTKNYTIRYIDTVKVKGKSKPVKIYEVIDFENKKLNFQTYYQAINLYQKGDFKNAIKIFENLLKSDNQKLYEVYFQRCKYLIENPPKNWDGIWIYNTK